MFKSKGLWVCVFIIVLLVLVAPFIDGLILQKSIERNVKHIKQQYAHSSFKITSYQRGWLSSKVSFTLDNEKGYLKLNHGPMTFDHGFHFGLASIPSGKIPLWKYGHSATTGTINLNGDLLVRSNTTFTSDDLAQIKKSAAPFIRLTQLSILNIKAIFRAKHDLSKSSVYMTLNNFSAKGMSPIGKVVKASVGSASLRLNANYIKHTNNYTVVPTLNIRNLSLNDGKQDSISFKQFELAKILIDSNYIKQQVAAFKNKGDNAIEKQKRQLIARLVTPDTRFVLSHFKLALKQFGRLNLNLAISFKNLQKNHTYDLLMKHIRASLKVNIPKFQYPGLLAIDSLKINEDINGFLPGQQNTALFSVDSLKLNSARGRFYSFQKAKFNSFANVKKADLADSGINLSIADINNSNLDHLKNFNASILFNNFPLELDSYHNFIQKWVDSIRNKKANYDQARKALIAHIIKTLKPNSQIVVKNVSFNLVKSQLWPLKNQQFKFASNFSWPTLSKTNSLSSSLRFDASLTVPHQSLWYVYPNLSHKVHAKAVPYVYAEVPAEFAKIWAVKMMAIVPQLVRNNIIITQGDNYTVSMKHQGGLLSINSQKPNAVQTAYTLMNFNLFDQAANILQAKQQQSNPTASNLLATLYMYGWGVKQDVQKAIKLRQAAAAANDMSAISMLSYDYFRGIGVAPNFNKATSLGTVVAAKAPAASLDLCMYYSRGQMATGIKPDNAKALTWCKKAYQLGYVHASKAISDIYTSGGSGVKVDLVKAIEYLLPATKVPSIASKFSHYQILQLLAKANEKQLVKIANDAYTGNDIISSNKSLAYIVASIADDHLLAKTAKAKLNKSELSSAEHSIKVVLQLRAQALQKTK